MIEAIHHVQVTVPTAALDAALVFYRDVFGLAPTRRPPEIASRGLWFRVFDRDLHVGVEDGVDRSATRAHVAFKADDLEALRGRLEAAGVVVGPPRHPFPGYERLQFRDPFGNLVELVKPLGNHVEVDRRPQPKVHLSVALMHEGKLLLVREGKPAMRDKWNLPGGHAERGEFAVPGAMRELLEETGVAGEAVGVLGLFSTAYSVRLVVLARAYDPRPIAGDEILESRFWSIEDARRIDDASFINPVMMRAILRRLAEGTAFPLDVVESIGG